METCGTGSQMQLWYLQLQPRFYYHNHCSCRGRCTEQRASHSCWRLTINTLLSGPIYVQGHFRSQRCSRTHYVPALMKTSCDWSPPSRCPLVTKLAFSPQSDISQAPVGLVSSDPEMFTYSLVFQWKKEQELCLKLSKWITLPHSTHVHHLSPHFNFSLSDHLMCSVGQLEFVFGLMHWVLSAASQPDGWRPQCSTCADGAAGWRRMQGRDKCNN